MGASKLPGWHSKSSIEVRQDQDKSRRRSARLAAQARFLPPYSRSQAGETLVLSVASGGQDGFFASLSIASPAVYSQSAKNEQEQL